MIWGKQFYCYDVKRWLDGDPTQPPPPPERRAGRNAAWTHLDARDILSMPDPWEYPWFAAWDLAFHTIALAHLDPAFAKYQLLVAVPRVVPAPERGAAGLRMGVRRRQPAGPRVGGAARVGHRRPPRPRLPGPAAAQAADELHLVGQPDRPRGRPTCSPAASSAWTTSAPSTGRNLPAGGRLEQADGTTWMAFYALTLLQMAMILAVEDDAWTDIEVKFIEHFVLIVDAMHSQGLWDDEDGFFYDVLPRPGRHRDPDQGPVDRRCAAR